MVKIYNFCIGSSIHALLFFLNILIQLKHRPKKKREPQKLDYKELFVDEKPPIKVLPKESKSYKELLEEYFQKHHKIIQPIKRRKHQDFDPSIRCPYCQAPPTYLYDNNGAKGQFLCKICNYTFFKNANPKKLIRWKCPYCLHFLSLYKDRKNHCVFKCTNHQCHRYQQRIQQLSKEELKDFKANPYKYNLHYIFRDFKFSLNMLNPNAFSKQFIKTTKSFKANNNIVGLALALFINYGLSTRCTARFFREVFNISISHQTVLNYVNKAAASILPFLNKYNLGFMYDKLVGDETYIKIKGKWGYVFFIFHPKSQIIFSQYVSLKRNTQAACTAIKMVFNKIFKLNPITFIFDGNPIYKLARIFFANNNVFFNIKHVIGLQNIDEESAQYRPYKQFIERLHRSFKSHFHSHFASVDGAIAAVTMFTAFFNFIKPNIYYDPYPPIAIPNILNQQTIQSKWTALIEYANNYHAP